MDRNDTLDFPGPELEAAPGPTFPPPAAPPPRRLRGRLFAILGAVVLIGAAAYGAWWYLSGAHIVSTDDAYVDASVAAITPQVAGTIRAVPVQETQHVKAGDVLVVIDPADAELAVAQADAAYSQARRRVVGYFANVDGAKADIAAREADLKRAGADYKRRAGLSETGAVSGDEITAARNALDNANAALSAARQRLSAASALVEGTNVDDNPEVLAAKANLDQAKLNRERTTIRSPIDGIIAQNTIQIGQRVPVGATLMIVVPIAEAHVNANFKEVQLDRVHPGQAAEVVSDLYGSDVVFHGRVEGIGGGTGAAFSVIPAQNATGNWIKVVQRLPVRIALDPEELKAHPLRVGLSMTVSIDTRQ